MTSEQMTTATATTATATNEDFLRSINDYFKNSFIKYENILNNKKNYFNNEDLKKLISKFYGFSKFDFNNLNFYKDGIQSGFNYALYIPDRDRNSEKININILNELYIYIEQLRSENKIYNNIIEVKGAYENKKLNIVMFEDTIILLFKNLLDMKNIFNYVLKNFNQQSILIEYKKEFNFNNDDFEDGDELIYILTGDNKDELKEYNIKPQPIKENITIFYE
jgi:hypothetical protein